MIQLLDFNLDDWKILSGWMNSEEELVQFAGPTFSYPLSREQIKAYLSNANRLVFKVVDVSNSQMIGMAEIYHVNNNVAKLARILIGDKSVRGKGYGFALMQKLTQYCFEHLNRDEVILNVFTWNSPAIMCYEKVGFTKSNKKADLVTVGSQVWKSVEMRIKEIDSINLH